MQCQNICQNIVARQRSDERPQSIMAGITGSAQCLDGHRVQEVMQASFMQAPSASSLERSEVFESRCSTEVGCSGVIRCTCCYFFCWRASLQSVWLPSRLALLSVCVCMLHFCSRLNDTSVAGRISQCPSFIDSVAGSEFTQAMAAIGLVSGPTSPIYFHPDETGLILHGVHWCPLCRGTGPNFMAKTMQTQRKGSKMFKDFRKADQMTTTWVYPEQSPCKVPQSLSEKCIVSF